MGWKTVVAAALVAGVSATATPAHAADGVHELTKPGTQLTVGCYAGWSINKASLLCEDTWAHARIVLQISEDGLPWTRYSGYIRSNLFAGEALTQTFFAPTGESIERRIVWQVRDGNRQNGRVDGRYVMPWPQA